MSCEGEIRCAGESAQVKPLSVWRGAGESAAPAGETAGSGGCSDQGKATAFKACLLTAEIRLHSMCIMYVSPAVCVYTIIPAYADKREGSYRPL